MINSLKLFFRLSDLSIILGVYTLLQSHKIKINTLKSESGVRIIHRQCTG